jgi:hypothetical protein
MMPELSAGLLAAGAFFAIIVAFLYAYSKLSGF